MAMKWNGPLEELPERLQVVIAEQNDGGFLKHPERVSIYAEDILKAVTNVWDALSDGFDLADLGALGSALGDLTMLAVDAKDLVASVVDDFVADCALVIYKIWDPDIPYLWESAENKLEALAIRAASTMAVSGIRRVLTKKDEEATAGTPGVIEGADEDSQPTAE